MTSPSTPRPPGTTVSTHILDTTAGRPAAGVTVTLSVRGGAEQPWTVHATAATDGDGRCAGLPALPEGTAEARLRFAVEPYLRDGGGAAAAGGPPAAAPPRAAGEAFFPEVTAVFAVRAGEHHHVPLLLNPFGYSVYRGS